MKPEELLPDDQLEQFFYQSIGYVNTLAAKGVESFASVAHILVRSPAGKLEQATVRLDFIPEDPTEKRLVFFGLGRSTRMQFEGIIAAVALQTEAWAVYTDRESMKHLRPSRHPQRIEVLVVTATARDGRSIGTILKIARRTDDKIDLVPMESESPAITRPNQSKGLRVESELIDAFFAGVESTSPAPDEHLSGS